MIELLDAVFHDEAARLVYADALCDRGDPHGELIQVQCALARAPDAALEARARELLEKHRDRWLGPWAKTTRRWWYDRGFLHALAIDAPSFANGLFGGPHPELRGLRILELVPSRDPDDDLIVASQLAYLLQAPELAALERLSIANYPLYADNIAALAEAPRLRALRLGTNRLTAASIDQLGAGPLPELRSLALVNQGLENDAAVALASSPLLERLTELDLSSAAVYDPGCNSITDDGALPLVTSPHLANLRRLRLSENPIGDPTLVALCASPHATALADLDLDFTSITSAAVSALHGAAFAPALARLHVGWTGVETVDAALALPNLRWLCVSGAPLTEATMLALATAPHAVQDLVLSAGRDRGDLTLPAHIADALRSRFGARWIPHAPLTSWP